MSGWLENKSEANEFCGNLETGLKTLASVFDNILIEAIDKLVC